MLKKFFLFMLQVYQFTLSAILGSHCRFYPTCSEYTRQAIEVHGLPKGILLGSKRLCKCHPFHPGGNDPVPPNEKIKV